MRDKTMGRDIDEGLLQAALDSGRLAVLHYDPADDTISMLADAAVLDRFRLDPSERVPFDSYAPYIAEPSYPDLRDIVRGVSERRERAEFECRAIDVHGEVAWFLVRARPASDGPAGAPCAVAAAIVDITRIKRAEQELEQRNRILEAIISSSPDTIGLVDADGKIVFMSDAAASVFDRRPEEVVGQSVEESELVHPADVERVRRSFERLLSGEIRRDRMRYRSARPHEEERILEAHRQAVVDAEGSLQGVVTIITDATEQTRLEVQAREASSAKAEFLSRMSHEMRTPLHSVLGFAQLLEAEDLEPEQRDSVRRILDAAWHLLELINEVLDVSTIDINAPQAEPDVVDVRAVVGDVLEMLRPQASERAVQLVDRLEPDTLVLGDARKLRQVVLNLVSNAIKFNRHAGTVAVTSLEAGTDRVRVAVTDSGRGIAPDLVDDVFTPFERLGAEQDRIEGAGIGLALCKHMVESMGGRIGFESRVGKGSTFWFELGRAEPGAPVPAPPRRRAYGRVLYMDGDGASRRQVEQALSAFAGVRVLTAATGRAGLEGARRLPPDLALVDLELPDLPAETVIEELRARDETARVPVVVVTQHPDTDERHRLLGDGALAYLVKPLDAGQIERVVDMVLEAPSRRAREH